MHFVWLMTTVVLFVSFFDDGNVKGNNLEIQVIQRLQEITDLKERMDSLQKNIEWYISTFLNNKFVTKINSMEQGLVQEKVIRINLENKIKSMERWRVPKQVNGGWTAWGSWTNCSSTCGKGINNRVRTCTNPAPADGGNYCDGDGKEYNECQISSCKVNGGWTTWGSWTNCSSTCGKGMNNRVRTCNNPAPANGGNYCDGVAMEYNLCEISSCKVNGGWAAWASWTSCTTTCGKGISHRTRTCSNPTQANGGDYCVGDALQYSECQISSCTVNGAWTLWGSLSSCSSSCGNGIQHRDRTCTNPVPANGGRYCDGQPTEYYNCQIQSCEVNGGWTLWTSWDQCVSSQSCGSGIQTMTRACTNPRPAHGGVYCDGDAIRYRQCLATSNCKARLVSGRLEVMFNGVWGTVCDDYFSTNPATVACRMMGSSGTGSVIVSASVPDGVDPIWLDDVYCLGTEQSLFECVFYEKTIGKHDCGHDEDVGVRCS